MFEGKQRAANVEALQQKKHVPYMGTRKAYTALSHTETDTAGG